MFENTRLERKIDRLERKIDLVMAHLGITVTDSIDFTEIDELVLQGKKIQAIKRYRDQDRTAGLAEAKNIIEERARRQ